MKLYNNTQTSLCMTALVVTVLYLIPLSAKSQTSWYRDLDRDQWGDPSVSQIATIPPSGYVANNLDCNDNTVNNSKWNYIGNPGFTSNAVEYVSFARDSKNTLYVAYVDVTTNKGNVMKYNGTNWVNVGSANFTPSDAEYISIATDNNDMPYVAYRDKATGYKATVQKFNGSNWVNVGGAGFSSGLGKVNYTTIKFSKAGEPYVMYAEDTILINWVTTPWITVKKFNGTNWVNVGGERFTKGLPSFQSFAFDTNDIPFVSFSDIYGKATVMKLNGNTWDTVGSSGFSPSNAYNVSLAIGSNNKIYVLFSGSQTDKLGVYTFNGATWQAVGTPANSAFGPPDYHSICVNENGVPIIAFNTVYAKSVGYRQNSWGNMGNSNISGGNVEYIKVLLDTSDRPIVAYKDDANTGKISVMRLEPVYTGSATIPLISATKTIIAPGDTTTITVDTGSLNDAASWVWYKGSCGGSRITQGIWNIDGSKIVVNPSQTTTYFVRSEGPCVANGICDSITINVPNSINNLYDVNLSIYPNPNTGVFTVRATVNNYQVSIFSISGRVIKTYKAVDPTTKLDLSHTPNGVYIVKIIYPDGSTTHHKILKQNEL